MSLLVSVGYFLLQKNRQDKESATGTFETPKPALQSGKPAFVFFGDGHG